jgi:hypothetical protein
MLCLLYALVYLLLTNPPSLAAAATSNSTILPELTSPLGPVVNLGYAAFAGNDTAPTGELHGPVTFFGGMPYAQPPLGNLRFRAPQMLDEAVVNGGQVPVTDARNWGPPCIPEPTQVGIGSEGKWDWIGLGWV